MTDRDEVFDLSRIICANSSATIGESDTAAQAILDAGYRKPRTITTVEELDALPEDSIIREGESVVATRIGNSWWYPTGPFEPNLPVTVLHNPEEKS